MCLNRRKVHSNTSLKNRSFLVPESQSESEILCDFHPATPPITPCEQQYTPPQLPPRPVHFMDIFTGEITQYDSFYQAGNALNVVPSAITNQFSHQHHLRLFARRYIVLDKNIDFSIITPAKKAALLNKAIKGYFIYHRETEVIVFSRTLTHAMKQFALETPYYSIRYCLKHRLFYRHHAHLFLTESTLMLYQLSERERLTWFKDKTKFLK